MLTTRSLPVLSSLLVVPFTLGIGIGVGVVGAASASTVSATVGGAFSAAVTKLKCATTGPCAVVTNSAASGIAIAGTASGTATSVGIVGSNTGAGTGIEATSNTGSALVASSSYFDPFGTTSPIVSINGSSSNNDGLDIAAGVRTSHAVSAAIATTSDAGAVYTTLGEDTAAIQAYTTIQDIDGDGHPGNAVFGQSTYGSGVVAVADNVGPVVVNGPRTPVSAVSAQAPNGADLYLGVGSGTFEVTGDGSVNASGTITGGVKCAPTACPSGTKFAAYTAGQTLPTMEDVGRGQLLNGAATVRFDAAFGAAIDPAKDYAVFLTPEGDTRGLFVARRTALGFTVAENMNGRSSATFSYRVVAFPYGSSAARLPVMRTQSLVAAATMRARAQALQMHRSAAALQAKMASAAPPATAK